jgi:antitoxin FitA
MSKMIQVRDVPDAVHSTLKARAAREGMSLSDYIKRELERVAERPTMLEWLEQTRSVKPLFAQRSGSDKLSSAQLVRQLRDSR